MSSDDEGLPPIEQDKRTQALSVLLREDANSEEAYANIALFLHRPPSLSSGDAPVTFEQYPLAVIPSSMSEGVCAFKRTLGHAEYVYAVLRCAISQDYEEPEDRMLWEQFVARVDELVRYDPEAATMSVTILCEILWCTLIQRVGGEYTDSVQATQNLLVSMGTGGSAVTLEDHFTRLLGVLYTIYEEKSVSRRQCDWKTIISGMSARYIDYYAWPAQTGCLMSSITAAGTIEARASRGAAVTRTVALAGTAYDMRKLCLAFFLVRGGTFDNAVIAYNTIALAGINTHAVCALDAKIPTDINTLIQLGAPPDTMLSVSQARLPFTVTSRIAYKGVGSADTSLMYSKMLSGWRFSALTSPTSGSVCNITIHAVLRKSDEYTSAVRMAYTAGAQKLVSHSKVWGKENTAPTGQYVFFLSGYAFQAWEGGMPIAPVENPSAPAQLAAWIQKRWIEYTLPSDDAPPMHPMRIATLSV